MPRSESTMASAGPSSQPRGDGAPRSAARSASGSAATRVSTSARPSLGFTPMRSNVSPCFANTSAKYVFTAWPKMIGSETFIIVAFRWIENSTPCALASAICSARNAVERARAHEGGVDDLTGQHRDRLLEHGGRAVAGHELDLQVVGGGEGDRLLVGAEVVGRPWWRRGSSSPATTRPSVAGATGRTS